MTPMEAAEKIRDALVKQYGTANTVDLMLWDAENCRAVGLDAEAALVWEGAPDPEWAITVSLSVPVVRLAGILAEPYNGHILNFYRN